MKAFEWMFRLCCDIVPQVMYNVDGMRYYCTSTTDSDL